MTCLSYLSFRYFDPDITDDEVDGFIDGGEYVLHQYSQTNFCIISEVRGATWAAPVIFLGLLPENSSRHGGIPPSDTTIQSHHLAPRYSDICSPWIQKITRS